MGIHMHLAQVPGEREHVMAAHGISPIVYMQRLGVLGPDTVMTQGFLHRSSC